MRLELTGRHVAITPAVRKAVEQRLARMARMLNNSLVSVQVVITRERSRTHVDMTMHARGDHFLHSEATGRTLPAALGEATEKLEHQAQKLKSKWTERKRQGRSAAKAGAAAPRPERAGRAVGTGAAAAGNEAEAAGPVRIVRARRYEVKPMSVDEAALKLVAGNAAFLVFRNAGTDAMSVLFRRPDGHLGLIESEA